MRNISKNISIKFDYHSLSAIIERNKLEDYSWAEIKLYCSDISDTSTSSSKSINIPWFEFRKIINNFAHFLSRENITYDYDENSKLLIQKHLLDFQTINRIKSVGLEENDDFETLLKSTSFKRTLKDAQLRDLKKLLSLKHGANFSVPGAGKTTTFYALYSILKHQGLVNRLLVVGPRNTFMSWEDEMMECLSEPLPTIRRLTGGKQIIKNILDRDPEIALITYQQLPYVLNDVTSFVRKHDVHIVLDESHRIKGEGIYYKGVIKLADFSYRRDILTGTPLPQSPVDLITQFNFLWPGCNVFDNSFKIKDDEKRIKLINKIIKPLFVRTTKSEMKLPKIETHFIPVELGPVQQELYSLMTSYIKRKISNMPYNDKNAFRQFGKQVVRLLQVASNPMLITSTGELEGETIPIPPGTPEWDLLREFSKYEKPAKIEKLIEMINRYVENNEKVVVWSSFVNNINMLNDLFSDFGAVVIHGGIETGSEEDAKTREFRIRKFHNEKKCKVLIANPAACGEGISLHKVCHRAIYLDRTFNAAHYLQSVDRIHRLGLSDDIETHIEVLVASNTIDERVSKRLRKKIDVMSAILDDYDLKALAYDSEDILEEYPGGLDQQDIEELMTHFKEET